MKLIQIILLFISIVFCSCKQNDPPAVLSRRLYNITSKPYPDELLKVKEFVSNGAKVNYVSKHSLTGNTPLLNAAGALENDRGEYTREGLRDSAEIEAVKIVKFLVFKGADLHATDSSANRRNALHLAAIGGRSRMIHALVELGIDINSRDRMNVTALIQAAGSGCMNAVKTCVELGADINLKMNGDRTALDAALEFGTEEAYEWGKVTCKEHDKIIEYLKQHGAKRGK